MTDDEKLDLLPEILACRFSGETEDDFRKRYNAAKNYIPAKDKKVNAFAATIFEGGIGLAHGLMQHPEESEADFKKRKLLKITEELEPKVATGEFIDRLVENAIVRPPDNIPSRFSLFIPMELDVLLNVITGYCNVYYSDSKEGQILYCLREEIIKVITP